MIASMYHDGSSAIAATAGLALERSRVFTIWQQQRLKTGDAGAVPLDPAGRPQEAWRKNRDLVVAISSNHLPASREETPPLLARGSASHRRLVRGVRSDAPRIAANLTPLQPPGAGCTS